MGCAVVQSWCFIMLDSHVLMFLSENMSFEKVGGSILEKKKKHVFSI